MTSKKIKSKLAAVAIITFLCLPIVSEQFVDFVKAKSDPDTTWIEVQSPQGSYANNSAIPIILNVELGYGTTEKSQFYREFSSQDILCAYSLDNGEWVNVQFIKVTSNKAQWDLNFPFINIIDCNYSTTLQGLTTGSHSLRFTVYSNSSDFIPDYELFHVNFTVYSPLQITVISPQNQTYHSSNLQLNSIINQQASWIGFSLDQQANETITGNTTLNGLSLGSHSLTLYGNVTVENTGASKTIYFDIQSPEPFPILAGVVILLIITVVVGVLLYSRRHKGKN